MADAEHYGFSHKDAVRVASATKAVEAGALSHQPRPRKNRGGSSFQQVTTTAVIVRHIPRDDGIVLLVERAVKHPDFAGDLDTANLGRWVSLSERKTMELPPSPPGEPPPPPVEPDTIMMATWMHTLGKDYELFVWPADVPTTRETDILTARKIGGDWMVKMDLRFLLRRVQPDARVGSCFPAGAFG